MFDLWPRSTLRGLATGLFCLLLSSHAPAKTDAPIVLLQPEESSRTDSAFFTTSQRIRGQTHLDIRPLPISEATSSSDINSWIKQNKPRAVITLGNKGYKLAQQLETDIPIISGGINLTPGSISGVSLVGDPKEFLETLKELAPSTKRVSLVFSKSINGWWIKDAAKTARKLGFELVALEAQSLRHGVQLYKELLDTAKPGEDAIWIPLVDIVPVKTIMPAVLKAAWDKQLIVFSNNPAHTKQGALFSLYPDTGLMGEQLVRLTEQSLTDPNYHAVRPTNNLKASINLRTAQHLGIKVSDETLLRYDRVYPQK